MSPHDDAELQDALDGRLTAEAREPLVAHLLACASCRAAYERLRWVKATLAASSDAKDVPVSLRACVAAALDEVDHEVQAASRRGTSRRHLLRWAAAGLAASLALVGSAALLRRARSAPADPAATLIRAFQRYRGGALRPAVATDDPEHLRAFFALRRFGIDARVLDLRMMGYRLVGGDMRVADDRPYALVVYRGDGGRIVLCAMYVGAAAAAAPRAEVRQHAGLTFYVHRQDGTTTVFWQEGAVACALVSDGESEQLVQLAYEKAMRAA